jgi:phage baseplate assembly protein W
MSITKPLAGIRLAATRVGDTLQAIAARELGDAGRWYDLASINNLLPPWITDDPAQAGPRVILAGANMLVPASAPQASGVTPEDADDAVLGTDLILPDGILQADGGDFALVMGTKNLSQAILHALATPRRSVVYHQDYGSQHHELLGARADPVANSLAALFVQQAISRDPRVARTEDTTATVAGDVIDVTATAVAVDGRRLPVRNI